MSFQRAHYQTLEKRIREPRRFIQVVLGPRQVGKTTLVNQLTSSLKDGYHYVSADSVPASDSRWVQQQWESARLMMKHRRSEDFLLVIDEIQKIDDWSEVVKSNWDSDTRNKLNMKVILLGSSRLLIQRGLSESLAGRFELIHMDHWTYSEMREAFGWDGDRYAWFGGYPGSAGLVDDEWRWKEYVRNALIETSISKDILMMSRIEKPALLKRLFELGCLYSGQVLSFTKIMGQLTDAGNTTTLSHYLELLDTAGLLGGIGKYAGDVIRKRASSPKFQVHNTALISAQSVEPLSEVRMRPERWGRIVESAVGAHLLNHSHIGDFSLYYWREGNEEMDFVLERQGKVVGLEVKSGASGNTNSMAAFHRRFGPFKTLLIAASGIPWQDFLSIDPSELF
jgi:predicted AAA+ superfamily ATPase